MSEPDKYESREDDFGGVRARYYQYLAEDKDITNNNINIKYVVAGLVFILTTVVPALIMAYKEIWTMQRDIQDIKDRDIADVVRDINANKVSIEVLGKTSGSGIKSLNDKMYYSDKRITDQENISSDILQDLYRIKKDIKDINSKVSKLDVRVRELEIRQANK